MSGPLTGYRIIDLTTTFSGPLCTRTLGDLGADVIKVERQDGDITRGYGPARSARMGSIFMTINRSKRSIVLDLKNPSGRDVFVALTKTADVLVHNMRADAMRGLQLDYDSLTAIAPRLVYCAITGYGGDGCYNQRPAYDDIIQGMTGLAWLQGVSTGGDPRYMATAIADRTAGITAALAIVAGLVHREKSGEAQRIEVPMFETLTEYVLSEQIGGRAYDPPLGPTGYQRMRSPYRRPYATKDGFICVAVYTGAHWRSFLNFVGRGTLLNDERYRTVKRRSENIDELYAIVAEEMLARTSKEWLEILVRLDVPVAPLNSLDSLLDDPHLREVNLFHTFEHPTEGTVVGMRNPMEFSRTPIDDPPQLRPAPVLGEHTREILAELGFPSQENE